MAQSHASIDLPWWEKSLIIFSFLLMMKAFIPLLELGAVDQTNRENSVILPPLLLLTYIFPLIYLAWNWREFFIKIRRLATVFVLLGYLIVSTAWSQFPEITLFRAVSALLTTLFAVYLSMRCSAEQIMHFFSVTVTILLLGSLLFVLLIPSLAISSGGLYGGSWNGVFQTKNALGLVLGIGCITFLFKAMTSRSQKDIALALCCFAMLYLSNAKSSLAASVLTLLFVCIFSAIRSVAPTRLPLFLTLSIISIIITITGVVANFEAILSFMGRDGTLTNRSEIWSLVEYYIQDNFWRGHGYRVFFAKPDVQMLFQQILQGRVPAHSHNIFIEMMLDGGIIGVFLLLFVLLQAFIRSIIYSISQPWAARYWYLAIMLYILIIGQVEAFSFSNYLWVLVVLVSGVVPTQQSTPAILK